MLPWALSTLGPTLALLAMPITTPVVVAVVPASAVTEQPRDEIKRQRQNLMEHTPAKPSRRREASVPSPSVLVDADNQYF
ncbi:hypothetical protein HBI81_031800 [Parastagonospora nodorum]|nr:hypothetical protein HBH52_074320 [Parastagonospora nodorum]KAH4082869.1 hypothetical protein HBH46_219760 [Parastagonospora nodorum]KAH5483722.1 hypothetical protein HBI31_174010 [Parastagonospora nodorum]KAH5711441.1 hypothetical protein HBI18_219600 [Parastagonospora nodorum]KAH5728896.1 hypothetical protein HBI17_225690 [Parastagonospora nodorum]